MQFLLPFPPAFAEEIVHHLLHLGRCQAPVPNINHGREENGGKGESFLLIKGFFAGKEKASSLGM